MLSKDWAFLWYVCTEYHVWKPILCWFHKSLVLWPRVSTSTLPTWSAVIWHSLRKSGAECFSFISSDDMKFKALGGRSSGRPFSLECSIEWRTQADGTFWITPLIRDDTLPLVSCLSWGFLGSNWFFNVKLAPWSLALSSWAFWSSRKTRFLILFGCTSFSVPLFHPCGTLVHAGEMYAFLY